MDNFNEIHEFSLLVAFGWVFVNVCFIPLLIQVQIVVSLQHMFLLLLINRTLSFFVIFIQINPIFRKNCFQSFDTVNLQELAPPVVVLIEIFIIIFLICEIGENVAIQFEKFETQLSQCQWYLLPMEMQQIFLIFMAHSQQIPNIESFGNIACIRETFKKVRF